MGKRKSKKPIQKKKVQQTLPTVFQCLFCNHENSVHVKIDKKANLGSLMCKVCGQTYQTATNYLSAPVDVYYDWVDACDAVEKEHTEGGTQGSRIAAAAPAASRAVADKDEIDDDDGFIVDDELDAEADYGDADE